MSEISSSKADEVNFGKDPMRKVPDEQIVSDNEVLDQEKLQDMDFERKVVETYRVVRLINMISGYFKGKEFERDVFGRQGEKFIKSIQKSQAVKI